MAKTKRRRAPKTALTPAETLAYFDLYRRHSRIYAWGFFCFIVPVVFGVIWWSMGELNADVFKATGFFAFVTFILAVFTRRAQNKSWVGKVAQKYIKQTKSRGEEGQADRITYTPIIEVRTSRGKKETLRMGDQLFDYFTEGDDVLKVSGFSYIEKVDLIGDQRVCIICGSLMPLDSTSCKRCGGLGPDHSAMRQVCGVRN